MKAIFLSASVPIKGRGNFFETADPFLIQAAVREFVMTTLGRRTIVWGGHPAITPMILAMCDDLSATRTDTLVLYQSKFFEGRFPKENESFKNVQVVDSVAEDLEASLKKMRLAMLSRADLEAAVFIGGMEGIFREYEIFRELHPTAKVIPVPVCGGAGLTLARDLGRANEDFLVDTDFARLFYSELGIFPNEERNFRID